MEEVSNRQQPAVEQNVERAPKGRVAYLSMGDLTGFFAYDDLSFPALAARGWEGCEIAWDRPNVDWSEFAAVVIRSTWDYTKRSAEFLQALEVIERSGTLLLNSLATVRWNLDKHYLRELEQRGVPIVPTSWLPRLNSRAELLPLFEQFQTMELVVKPTIGANADDAFRLRQDDPANWESVEQVYRERPLQAQPFLESIVSEGEYSLFYFDGVFSHAVLKRPATGDFRVQEEHGGQISASNPATEIKQAAERAMAALPEPVLYGRVDLVRLADDSWRVIEIELIEPSLYFPYAPESIERFVAALDRRLEQRRPHF